VDRIHPYERSVAVIGSGVSGLVAAYALSARDRVTLFEADTRIGGHAHTHYVDRGDGYTVGVDSAFLVHNDRTYPTLCRLFDELGVATQETDMSMSVRDDASGLEYAGARGIGGLFPSWSTLTRPRYLLMLAEIKRFHAAATRLLQTDADAGDAGDGVRRARGRPAAAVRRGRERPGPRRPLGPHAADRRRGRHARRIRGPARLLPLLRRPFHDTARRGGVVVPAG